VPQSRDPRLPSVLRDEPCARLKGYRVADAVIEAEITVCIIPPPSEPSACYGSKNYGILQRMLGKNYAVCCQEEIIYVVVNYLEGVKISQ
jgi:hypothetical protein